MGQVQNDLTGHQFIQSRAVGFKHHGLHQGAAMKHFID